MPIVIILLSITVAIFILSQLRSLILLIITTRIDKNNEEDHQSDPHVWPGILIQLPVYNEGWGIRDAAMAAMNQNYAGKFLVQIIDDSPERTEDLVDFLKDKASHLKVEFQYLFRPDRKGYKSGALNFGMSHCDHSLILVLDADFIIEPDFLRKCVPMMKDNAIAGVQTCWSYRNGFLNAVSAIQLAIFDTIFALEQNVRRKLKIPAMFTGTSGIWRRDVIQSINGWKEEPFTAEDVDLSYKSYHLGYGFRYVDSTLSSCEATPNYIAFKHQQQRWARGVFQAAVDNAKGILTARQSLKSKIFEVTAILYNLSPFLLLIFGVLSSIYILGNGARDSYWMSIQLIMTFLILAGPTSVGVNYAVKKYSNRFGFKERGKVLASLLLSTGIAIASFLGILEVFRKSKKEFVVTPKGENTATINNSAKKWLQTSKKVMYLEVLFSLSFGLVLFVSALNYPESAFLFLIFVSSSVYSVYTSFKSLEKV